MKEVLLICGSGASSGFMAAAIRKAVKKQKLDYHVIARSESQLQEYIDKTDVLLIGPHLSYIKEEITEQNTNENLKIEIIPQDIYGSLNGEKCLEMILSLEGE